MGYFGYDAKASWGSLVSWRGWMALWMAEGARVRRTLGFENDDSMLLVETI